MSSTPYDRQTSFALYSAENPSEPHSGTTLDEEFNAVKVALDDTQQNLAQIQDDDGALKRGSVGQAQFDSSVSIGFGAPSQWESGRIYTEDVDTVFFESVFYIANTTHTSGVAFEPANWDEIADFTLAAVIPDGSITSAKLASGAIEADKIAAGSVSEAKIAAGAVSNSKIADGTIEYTKLNAANIAVPLANLLIPVGLGPLPWPGATAPTGWVLGGATYNRADYPALWTFAETEIAGGSLWFTNGNGTTTFTITATGGYVVAGREASASRLTATYFGGNSTVNGAVGGSESQALVTANLASHSHANTAGVNDSGHTHSVTTLTGAGGVVVASGGGFASPSSTATSSNTTGITVTMTNASSGSGTAHNNTQSTKIANMIFKAH